MGGTRGHPAPDPHVPGALPAQDRHGLRPRLDLGATQTPSPSEDLVSASPPVSLAGDRRGSGTGCLPGPTSGPERSRSARPRERERHPESYKGTRQGAGQSPGQGPSAGRPQAPPGKKKCPFPNLDGNYAERDRAGLARWQEKPWKLLSGDTSQKTPAEASLLEARGSPWKQAAPGAAAAEGPGAQGWVRAPSPPGSARQRGCERGRR